MFGLFWYVCTGTDINQIFFTVKVSYQVVYLHISFLGVTCPESFARFCRCNDG